MYLHQRQFEALAVLAAEEFVRGRVAGRLGFRVERQRLARAVRDVPEMAKSRALVPLLDLRVRLRVAANARDEVADVLADHVALRLLGHAVAAANLPRVAGEEHRPLIAVNRDAVRLTFRPLFLLLPDAMFPD